MNLPIIWTVFAQMTLPAIADNEFSLADLQSKECLRRLSFPPRLDLLDRQTGEAPYSVQPYLAIAADLQALPEGKRIAKLLEYAGIESLEEPTIILCRMLVESRDGSPLRRPDLGGTAYVVTNATGECPDEPIVLFKDIPFYAPFGYMGTGQPESARQYLEYALQVGRWRSIRYRVIEEKELLAIAEQFIARQPPSQRPPGDVRRWVFSQVGPPTPKQRTSR